MTDPGWAAEMSKLTVGLTVLLVAYAVAHKQRLKRRTKKAASVDPDKLWPKVPGMERGSVLTEQGVRLATFRFDAQHPKAAAILVHGVGVSCRFEFLRTTCDGGLRDRYEDSALDIMRRAGISILGYDHQSHGSSESLEPGVRCYIDQFDDLCRDLLLVHETFCASLPAGTPVFWVGISMGGGVAVRAAQMLATSRPPRGLVLLAPMISLTAIRDEYFCRWLGLRNGHLVPLMHSLSRLVPRLPIVARAKSAVHPHMEAELQADPLNWTRSFRVRVSCEFVKVTESMMARGGPASLEKLRCGNLLAIHSKADTFTEPLGSLAVYERCACAGSSALVLIGGSAEGEVQMKGAPLAHSALKRLTSLGMWHALTTEPGFEEVAAAVAEWILAAAERPPQEKA